MDVRVPLAVAAGGTVGTAARLGVDLAIPDVLDFPFAILLVNMVGSFAIGLVMMRVTTPSTLRMFLATGMLGGFTTYSAFAVATVETWASAPTPAALFVFASLTLGPAAAWAGLRVGRRRRTDAT